MRKIVLIALIFIIFQSCEKENKQTECCECIIVKYDNDIDNVRANMNAGLISTTKGSAMIAEIKVKITEEVAACHKRNNE